ncbi:hypothetical protein DM45_2190 [Burkholderia mallei]|nr:hypothetical protein DM45_2190 [Burkholderia mallei]
MLDLLEKLAFAVARAQFERVLFLDRRAIGRVRHDHRFAQILSRLARIAENFRLQLFEPIFEEGELILIHVILVAHLQDFGFGQEFLRHLLASSMCGESMDIARTLGLPATALAIVCHSLWQGRKPPDTGPVSFSTPLGPALRVTAGGRPRRSTVPPGLHARIGPAAALLQRAGIVTESQALAVSGRSPAGQPVS